MKQLPQARHIRKLLGVNVGKLPIGSVPTKTVNIDGIDILVHILSRNEARQRFPHANRPHRVCAQCPECYTWVSAARLAQHYKVHQKG